MKKFLFLFALFFVLGLNAQEKQSTAQPNVKIISENFEMPQLHRNRRIWVYLPPDYESSKKKYPVMYLHDGQNLFDDKTSFSGEWQIDESLNKIFSETQKSAIVVGIDNGGDKRIDELTPWKNEKYGGGESDQYLKFIVETLKPYIDKNYRTKTCAKFTTLGGSSLGALISVYGGVKYPKTFGKILAFSPAFWINLNELGSFIKQSKGNLKKQKYYFIQGKHESEKIGVETSKIIQDLEKKGVKKANIFFRADEDGKHNEMYWRREFRGAFLWLN